MSTITHLLPAYRLYLEHEAKRSPMTVAAYLSDLRRLAAFVDDRPIGAIQSDDLRAYMRVLSQAGLSTRTVERKMACFSTFWKWLKLEGRVTVVITESVRVPKPQRRLPVWLTESELLSFASTPDPNPRNDLAWKVLAWLGLRRGELLRLRCDDVLLEDRILIIRRGKGGRDRALPLPDALWEHFQRYLTGHTNERVFPSNTGGDWSPQSFTAAFKEHLKRCGLGGRGLTPHSLRHSFATHLLNRGANIVEIQALLGHADIKSTLVYMHIDQAHLRQAVNLHPLIGQESEL